MSSISPVSARAVSARKSGSRKAVLIVLALVVIAAIALDTTVVSIGGDDDLRQQAFDPDNFGQGEFPRIRDYVITKAPDAVQLAQQLVDDKKAAIDAFGTLAGAFPVLTVSFTGVLGEGKSGIFPVVVDGMPDGTGIRLQTGPAINGTELRDITGDIEFGAFKNQIEYQDAGSGINRAMSAEVLADLDRPALMGKSATATGVFTMINPKNWLVTPVSLEVQ